MKKGFSAIAAIIITVLVMLGLAGGGYYLLNEQHKSEKQNLQNQIDELKQESESAKTEEAIESDTLTWKTYTNTEYGFKFKYPKTWTEYAPYAGSELILNVGFKDPEREKDMEKSKCVNNEAVGWLNPEPTQEECKETLAALTEKEKSKLSKLLLPKNIMVSICQDTSTSTLYDWLVEKNKQPGTELQDYEPGKKITLGGVEGYVSDTGCCADYHLSYVIKKNSYVYSVSTSYEDGDLDRKDNTLLQQIAETFEFIE